MEISFIGRKYRLGTSFVVTIPKGISDCLSKVKKYCFVIKEVQNDEDNKENLDG
jgi:hypothetical protein